MRDDFEASIRRAVTDARKNPLDPIDCAEFLAKEMPRPGWIIPNFLGLRYQAALFGKSKSRKSFFAIQLGLCVACGKQFLGFPAPEKPRRVAYFNLELAPEFLHERLKAQTDALGMKPQPGYFRVFNLRGCSTIVRNQFDACGHEPPNPNCSFADKLRKDEIDLAILDPRYKLLRGAEDENSAAGLRALLEFRTAFANVCTVLFVGHDPKGDIANKALLDRGAGSYTQGADDDCTILLTPNGYAEDAVTVETVHRNRPPIKPFVAVFDGKKQSFSLAPNIPVETVRGKSPQALSPVEKAKKQEEKRKAFKTACLSVAQNAGANLLGKAAFKSRLSTVPGGAIGQNCTDTWLRELVESGDLAQTPELKRSDTGDAVGVPHGQTLVSTPDRIAAYRADFGLAD